MFGIVVRSSTCSRSRQIKSVPLSHDLCKLCRAEAAILSLRLLDRNIHGSVCAASPSEQFGLSEVHGAGKVCSEFAQCLQHPYYVGFLIFPEGCHSEHAIRIWLSQSILEEPASVLQLEFSGAEASVQQCSVEICKNRTNVFAVGT